MGICSSSKNKATTYSNKQIKDKDPITNESKSKSRQTPILKTDNNQEKKVDERNVSNGDIKNKNNPELKKEPEIYVINDNIENEDNSFNKQNNIRDTNNGYVQELQHSIKDNSVNCNKSDNNENIDIKNNKKMDNINNIDNIKETQEIKDNHTETKHDNIEIKDNFKSSEGIHTDNLEDIKIIPNSNINNAENENNNANINSINSNNNPKTDLNGSFDKLYKETLILVQKAKFLKDNTEIVTVKKPKEKRKLSHNELLSKGTFDELIEASEFNCVELRNKIINYKSDNKNNNIPDKEKKIKDLSNSMILTML